MKKQTRILVAGGDLRQIYLADYLSTRFYVKKYALGEKMLPVEILKGFDIIILPMIISTDGENLNAPFSEETVPISKLVHCLKENGRVFGGNFPSSLKGIFTSHGYKVFEYMSRDELVIKNCIPTAEGALQLALEQLPVTVKDLDTLVLGFGRVGKVTAEVFKSIGANVVATARKNSDLAFGEAMKIKMKKTSETLKSPQGIKLVINTVPALLVDKKVLDKLDKDCLVIDLASRPGGVDFDYAKEIGIRTIWALSLPPVVTGAKLFYFL